MNAMSLNKLLLILSLSISILSCDNKNHSANIDSNTVALEKPAVEAKDTETEKSSSEVIDQIDAPVAVAKKQSASPVKETDQQQEPKQNTKTQTEAESVSTQQEREATKSEILITKEEELIVQSSTKVAQHAEIQKTNSADKSTTNVKENLEERKPAAVTPIVREKKETVEQDKKGEVMNIHDQWQVLLQKHVSSSGVVNYKGLKGDETSLDAYISDLSDQVPGRSDNSKKAKAFWINAYNAFTVKLILDNYPVNSIRDIAGGKPWDKKWINLGSNTYTLNNIEHDILRPMWKDARIHFAVNCAAKSCPPLGNRAFTSGNTDNLLEQLTKQFVNDARSNTISSSSLELSKIFEWYETDFGDLAGFIDKYTTVKIPSNVKITYQDYDWSLNGK